MSEKLSAEELAQARALWDAVQNETRGVGIDDAGDLRSPKSHEDFERFVYRSWPRLLAHITTLQREADGLRAALERIANFAPGYGEAAEYIATMARHALYSELAEMAANERALATNEPPRSSDGEK